MASTTTGKTRPEISSKLRHNILKLPEEIRRCSGIVIFGRRIKSLVFTTDIAIIRNCDADAVFAVYPFTPQQTISDALIKYASMPVFCGVGGGTTQGARTVTLARDVECEGAWGVVLNAPVSNFNVRAVAEAVDIPTIITVVSADTDVRRRLDSGAAILNVAGGAATPDIIRKIRKTEPEVPIIASGGNEPESILRTIEAGANAITYTPPTTQELFSKTMGLYRENPTPQSDLAMLTERQRTLLHNMYQKISHSMNTGKFGRMDMEELEAELHDAISAMGEDRKGHSDRNS